MSVRSTSDRADLRTWSVRGQFLSYTLCDRVRVQRCRRFRIVGRLCLWIDTFDYCGNRQRKSRINGIRSATRRRKSGLTSATMSRVLWGSRYLSVVHFIAFLQKSRWPLYRYVSCKHQRHSSLTMRHVCIGKVLLIAHQRSPILNVLNMLNKTQRTAKRETRYEYMHTDASLIPCAVGLSVKCVPLRLSVRDTSRSSRSSYVIGNGGEIFILRARLRTVVSNRCTMTIWISLFQGKFQARWTGISEYFNMNIIFFSFLVSFERIGHYVRAEITKSTYNHIFLLYLYKNRRTRKNKKLWLQD